MDDLLEIELAADTKVLEDALAEGEQEIRAALGAAVATYAWPLLRSRLAGAILREISENWLGWLVDGWCLAREIFEYTAADKVASGATASVKVGRHPLGGKLPVEVRVTCAGIAAPPIRFDVKLTADIHAVTLWIRRGHIVGIEGGQCELKANILFLEKSLCQDLPLKTLTLPLRRDFTAPGIPIPGRFVPPAPGEEPSVVIATIPDPSLA